MGNDAVTLAVSFTLDLQIGDVEGSQTSRK